MVIYGSAYDPTVLEGIKLFYLRVLSFGLFEDWDFRICALPQFQEISVRGLGACAIPGY
jgi:hypothetical protein